ncbi:glycoside hydrolase family 78 protein [Melioribacter sp. OK-6-Me]|uniref:glycoside hydrolase family 78 protein n=1 Tax=unclassified Melioribacter TaxID=2627329 RepID=UPI003EDAFE9F
MTVVPSAPNNASIVYDDDVTLYWYLNGSNLGITGFEIQYSQQSNFGSPVTIAPGTVGNNYSYQLTGLTPGATYYWRVRGYYSGSNYTPYSTIFSFTIDPGASSVVPVVGSPKGGVVINTAKPMLSWFVPAPSKSELKYDVELSSTSEFNDTRTFENLAQLHAAVETLTPGEYYWRVRSKTGNGDVSNYSEAGYFKVGDNVTDLEESLGEVPADFALEQNYPNPFNPETVIKFSLPKSQFISLKIYNVLGQEVKTLVYREFQAGNHSVVWNGKDNYGNTAAAGIYFYKIDAGEFTAVKKMILMK